MWENVWFATAARKTKARTGRSVASPKTLTTASAASSAAAFGSFAGGGGGGGGGVSMLFGEGKFRAWVGERAWSVRAGRGRMWRRGRLKRAGPEDRREIRPAMRPTGTVRKISVFQRRSCIGCLGRKAFFYLIYGCKCDIMSPTCKKEAELVLGAT